MEPSGGRTRQQQFPSEQVHLDFAPSLTAVVDDPLFSNGSRLGGASGIDVHGRVFDLIVAKRHMAEFVRDEERILEVAVRSLVLDAPC